ncbi:hypothetical protein C0J52_18052 [Blattella germanica]|nr:hypothetical protein C0J52_18052 [Blattella germanica]
MENVKRRKQLKPKQCQIVQKLECDKKELGKEESGGCKDGQSVNCVDKKFTGLSCRGLRPASSAVDRNLWEWYCEAKSAKNSKVTKSMVQARAKKAFHQAGIENFKASDGWYRRWVSRWRRFGYCKTAVGDEAPGKKDASKSPADTTQDKAMASSSESETGPDPKKTKVQNCSDSKYLKMSDNMEAGVKTDNATTLSTPMLNIVDYLPPEIMQGLQSNKIPDNNVINSTNTNTDMSNTNTSVDCYYSPSYQLLSGCDQGTLPNLTFEMHQNDLMPTTPNETERLKDLFQCNRTVLQIYHSLILKEMKTSYLHALRRIAKILNVALSIDEQEESSNGSAHLTSTVNHDALAPEVILESRICNVETKVDEITDKKKSRSKDLHHSSSSAFQRKRGERYLPQFKAKVLAYASSHTLKATSKKFKVNDGTIISWKKEKNWKEQLAQVQAKGLELYRARGNEEMKCSYRWYKRWCDRFHVLLRHEGDEALLEWALTQLERGHSLTLSDLQVQALNLASHNAFKASRGWAIRFCKRYPELLQQSPLLDTSLPAQLLQEVQKFRSSVQKIIADKNFTLGSIGNMDELYINFSNLMSESSRPEEYTFIRIIFITFIVNDAYGKNAFIQKKWLMFNSRSSTEWDVGDNKLHLPGWKDIVEWVSSAYHELQATEQETVRRSFLVTGLTVSPNRSEDHFIENLSMIPKTNANI